jgi:hypothetical protein
MAPWSSWLSGAREGSSVAETVVCWSTPNVSLAASPPVCRSASVPVVVAPRRRLSSRLAAGCHSASPPVVFSGFAAGCEARLRLAVALLEQVGSAPGSGPAR